MQAMAASWRYRPPTLGADVPLAPGWRTGVGLAHCVREGFTAPMHERPAPHSATQPAEVEAELLDRVAAGDIGAPLEELYHRYEGILYGLGSKLLGDAGLAEELVQETFVRLWQQAGRFDPARGTVRTFVFTIARRIAVDLWRRPSSRPFEPIPTADQRDDADEPSSADPAEEVIEALTIRDALRALTPAHRQVLELYIGQDRTQTEIAQLLGLPVGTVKTRTYYGLRAFKLALQERGLERDVHA
jgi:RNA polymerase sigma-70 factor, ECF subfamily